MSYQALLFCPDERTARTVTQVLSELEFSVEPCNEAFAAVKKLMAGHFDAIVVDCDNEQNATLLFKSARSSTSNQTSLAVAVVEGQAGVAKAFRIGANLVLTKPINVEQAKGTLRVARGLLRKGDPAKSVAPAASPAAPVAAAPAPAAPAVPAKPAPRLGVPAAPRPAAQAPVVKPVAPQVSKPIPAAVAKAVTPAPVAKIPDPVQADVLDVDSDEPAATPAITNPVPPAFKSTPAPPRTLGTSGGVNPSMMAPSSGVSPTAGGAASAAAPARTPHLPEFEKPAPVHEHAAAATDLGHVSSSTAASSAQSSSFTFGGANLPAQSASGGSKKAFIGVAAGLLIGAALYFGWTQFHGKATASAPVTQQSAPVSAATTPLTTVPSKTQPAASTPVPQSQASLTPSVSKPEHQVAEDTTEDAPEPVSAPTKSSAKKSSVSAAPTKSAPASEPAGEPRMVKNGSAAPAQPKPAPPVEAPAPSVLGMTAAPSGGGLPNLIANSNTSKPVLQTLNISQGVSQGLLIKRVAPTYPSAAMRMHVEGTVLLNATIAKSGNIIAVKVVSGEPLLAQSAVEAVKQWKYKPYFLNGEPVEIQTQVTVNFKLPH